MYKYYKAPGWLDKKGYYSQFYQITYHDGYGYNFYTKAKGYYEYSRAPSLPKGGGWDVYRFLETLGVMLGLIAAFAGVYII